MEYLDDYNTYRLMKCEDMPVSEIKLLVRCLNNVPDEILEMVADQLSIEQREIIDQDKPKLNTHPAFVDVAKKCLTAIKLNKEMDELMESRKPPKPPIRRTVL